MNLTQGEQVLVRATVIRARIDQNVDPDYHSVDLQLPDGQFLQTNVRNLHQRDAETKALEAAPENKAIESAPATKTKARK
jgi:hypothetical protein